MRTPRFTLFPYTTLFRSLRILSFPPEEMAAFSLSYFLLLTNIFGKRRGGGMRFRLRRVYSRIRRRTRKIGIHRSEEHTSELQSRPHLVCRLLLEKKKKEI